MRYRPLMRIAETPEDFANIIHFEISNDSLQMMIHPLTSALLALSISTQPSFPP
jgi:hypothetical protein